jgi:hypothetical protein
MTMITVIIIIIIIITVIKKEHSKYQYDEKFRNFIALSCHKYASY